MRIGAVSRVVFFGFATSGSSTRSGLGASGDEPREAAVTRRSKGRSPQRAFPPRARARVASSRSRWLVAEPLEILDESFTKGGSGHVRVVPDTSEDMWQLFNLLRADDHVEAHAFRKVSRAWAQTAPGRAIPETSASSSACSWRASITTTGEAVRGEGPPTATEDEHVKLGAYHTLDLDTGRPVRIEKHEWDGVDVVRLREAADPPRTPIWR